MDYEQFDSHGYIICKSYNIAIIVYKESIAIAKCFQEVLHVMHVHEVIL